MESMDNFRERFEALEQRTEQLQQHTRRVERRLRWWRGITCGVVLLGLVSLPLPSGTAQDESAAKAGKGLASRVEALEYKLVHVTSGPDDVTITGANLHIVNGLGSTETTNGLGNLIVGYNQLRGDYTLLPPDVRTGSHNVVVGTQNNFSSFGGLVVGEANEISGQFASVSGGEVNTASGFSSSVSGGNHNSASGQFASVSGGSGNTASGVQASVSGGGANTASAHQSWVSGGGDNTASGDFASISGGAMNTASGFVSSISGGRSNIADGDSSSVSGGLNRTAPAMDNWAAGALFSDN